MFLNIFLGDYKRVVDGQQPGEVRQQGKSDIDDDPSISVPSRPVSRSPVATCCTGQHRIELLSQGSAEESGKGRIR